MQVRSEGEQRSGRRAAGGAGVRAHNAALLLNLAWESKGISRAELARQTGLSRSTVSDIVSELLQQGLIEESHVARSTGGRPPIVLRFRDERFRLIGVEMGASHISAVVTDVRGLPRVVFHCEHDVQNDPDGAIRLTERTIERCIRSVSSEQHIVGIGVAVPCPIDPQLPDQLSRRILPKWQGVQLGKILRARFPQPIFIDNDANLGALAERWWGAGRLDPDFAFVKVATGVGAGIIIDGHIYRGSGGIAGEIGHTIVEAQGPRCRCGLSGCLEALIGADALLQQLQKLKNTHPDSALAKIEDPRLTDLVQCAKHGDTLAIKIIARAGHALGGAIANLLNIFNPATIILGGSLTRAGEDLLKPIRETVQKRALWHSIADTRILISTLGEEAIALGAATQVLAAALTQPTLFSTPESK
jgi:predicted NBD/HSP70 family sugar kinase